MNKRDECSYRLWLHWDSENSGHNKTPNKRPKGKSLTKQEKQANRAIATGRVLNKNVIGCLKGFKILSDRYRN
ncbi:MAG: transposase family protein [Rhabdochlamydiaceae bacterium]